MNCPDLNVSGTKPNEKFEFVEHVLGVLIESRYGPGPGYTTLGERPVTMGHSQMFANVRLLTATEIGRHLEFGDAHHQLISRAYLRDLPLASADGSWPMDKPGFSPTLFWAEARELINPLNRRLKPTAIRRTQNDLTSLPRGSPTFLGRAGQNHLRQRVAERPRPTS